MENKEQSILEDILPLLKKMDEETLQVIYIVALEFSKNK